MRGRMYHYVDRDTKEEFTMWICPEMLFELGRYPKYLYIRKYDNTISSSFLVLSNILFGRLTRDEPGVLSLYEFDEIHNETKGVNL